MSLRFLQQSGFTTAADQDDRCVIRQTSAPAVQRVIARRLAVLNDRLYMGIRAEQVMPGESAAKRPDMAHWKTVVVRLSAPLQQAFSGRYRP